MNPAPVIRFALSFAILMLAAGGGYFSSDPAWKTFLYGASIMLLLPLTLALMLDVARRAKSRTPGSDSRVARAALSIPLRALAFCAFGVGAYLLVAMAFGATSNDWFNIVAGVLVAMIFAAFGVKVFRVLWYRRHDRTIP